MAGGFAPRFLVEAGFLILLGVGAGYADLRTIVIVAVLGAGWLLVSLIEAAVWRTQSRPVGPFVPPSPPPSEEVGEETADALLAPPPAPADVAYPLRADPGEAPSEEIEAYTRVLDDEPPPEGADVVSAASSTSAEEGEDGRPGGRAG
jgi:hypothetical protein